MGFWNKKERVKGAGGAEPEEGADARSAVSVPIPKTVRVPGSVRPEADPAHAQAPKSLRRTGLARVLFLADPEKRCAAAAAKFRAAGADVVECEDVAAAGVALGDCGMFVFSASENPAGLSLLLERAWDSGCQLVGLCADGEGTPPWVAGARFAARMVAFDEEGEIWEQLVDAAATPVRAFAADGGDAGAVSRESKAGHGSSAPIRRVEYSFERSVGHSVLGRLAGWVVVMDRVGLILGSSRAFSEAVSKRGRLFGRFYWEALPVRECGFGMKEHAAVVEAWRTGEQRPGFEVVEEVFVLGGDEVRVLWSQMPFCPDGRTVQGLVRFGVPMKQRPGSDARENEVDAHEESGEERASEGAGADAAGVAAVDTVFDAFFSATREAMVRLDAKGRIVAVNPALRRLMEWADDRDPAGEEIHLVFPGGYSRIGGWARLASGMLVGIEEVPLPDHLGLVCRVCERTRQPGASASDLRRRLGDDLRLLASLAEISSEAATGGGAQDNIRLALIAYAATSGAEFAEDQLDAGPLLGSALNLVASGCGVRLKWRRHAGKVNFEAGSFLLLALLVRYLFLSLRPAKGERFEVALCVGGANPCLRMERATGGAREVDEGALGIAGLLAERAGCVLDVANLYEGVVSLRFTG